MKRPNFLHGVAVAAVFGFCASAVIATLTPFVGLGAVVRFVIPALGLAYILYLYSRTLEKTGRLTTISLWSVLAVTTWWLTPPLPVYLLVHVGAVWLVRSLYFYSGIVPALMDLGLSALSISASIWAITRSGSIFLAVWCFFLVQALFVAIPPAVNAKANRQPRVADDSFNSAKRQADKALQQLFSQ